MRTIFLEYIICHYIKGSLLFLWWLATSLEKGYSSFHLQQPSLCQRDIIFFVNASCPSIKGLFAFCICIGWPSSKGRTIYFVHVSCHYIKMKLLYFINIGCLSRKGIFQSFAVISCPYQRDIFFLRDFSHPSTKGTFQFLSVSAATIRKGYNYLVPVSCPFKKRGI